MKIATGAIILIAIIATIILGIYLSTFFIIEVPYAEELKILEQEN